MLRTALRPRYLGLLALMVAATLVCGLLAGWQWQRAHRALTESSAGPRQLGDLTDVLEVGDAVTNQQVGGFVTAAGEFDAEEQIVVGGRSVEGTEAVIVVTALRVPLADGGTARLPVARGWVPAAEVTGPDGELDPALAPAPPAGPVELRGRLEASEAAQDGITGGVAQEIATPLLVNAWGSPMYSGYVAQTSAAEGLQPMPAAESAFSRGLDWQNIGYAAQWIVFGVFFLYLWGRTVRTGYLDELAEQRERMQQDLEEPRGTGSPVAAATVPARPDPQEDADVGPPTHR